MQVSSYSSDCDLHGWGSDDSLLVALEAREAIRDRRNHRTFEGNPAALQLPRFMRPIVPSSGRTRRVQVSISHILWSQTCIDAWSISTDHMSSWPLRARSLFGYTSAPPDMTEPYEGKIFIEWEGGGALDQATKRLKLRG